eukprot:15243790-Ditylum_brightwellii.AAC.1
MATISIPQEWTTARTRHSLPRMAHTATNLSTALFCVFGPDWGYGNPSEDLAANDSRNANQEHS